MSDAGAERAVRSEAARFLHDLEAGAKQQEEELLGGFSAAWFFTAGALWMLLDVSPWKAGLLVAGVLVLPFLVASGRLRRRQEPRARQAVRRFQRRFPAESEERRIALSALSLSRATCRGGEIFLGGVRSRGESPALMLKSHTSSEELSAPPIASTSPWSRWQRARVKEEGHARGPRLRRIPLELPESENLDR